VVLILLLVAAAGASTIIMRSHGARPAAKPDVAAPPASDPAGSAKPAAAPGAKAANKKKQPLPELVPGSPLTDDIFAQISAEIVIGAMGLKHDAQWQANVLAFMAKVLGKHKMSIEDYNAYAKALYDQPDRARAVAENIVTRVEKQVGYRISMDKLPMFKFDQKTIKEMQRRLER